MGRTVAPALPVGTEDGAEAYEVVSASLLDGDFWNSRRSARGKVSAHVAFLSTFPRTHPDLVQVLSLL